jgi:hypothetical protein
MNLNKNNKMLRNKLALLGFVFSFSFGLSAQDRQFSYVYQSTTLGKGAIDVEGWNTLRTGRKDFYRRLDQRIEFETGVTTNLQTALYFNSSHFAVGDSVGLTKFSDFSFSNEWKWKLSDPVANKIGFALYGEVGVSTDEIELESKIILDKRIGNHLFAFNGVAEIEYEMEWEPAEHETELEVEAIPLQAVFGYMYMSKPKRGFGIESKYEYETAGGYFQYSALFAGPSFFCAGERHFFVLTLMPQLANLKKTTQEPGSKVINHAEKFELRLIFGLNTHDTFVAPAP